VQVRNHACANCQCIITAEPKSSVSGVKTATASGTALAPKLSVANSELKHVSESSKPSSQVATPVCDEWGFYDPKQAGLEAVMRKLLDRDAAETSVVAAAVVVTRR
jgi:hypothetical protein